MRPTNLPSAITTKVDILKSQLTTKTIHAQLLQKDRNVKQLFDDAHELAIYHYDQDWHAQKTAHYQKFLHEMTICVQK